jgi:hypothetical protein
MTNYKYITAVRVATVCRKLKGEVPLEVWRHGL